jgi:ABC-type nitrate/sulfonate/bicarbonate transport system substrate-binding protein
MSAFDELKFGRRRALSALGLTALAAALPRAARASDGLNVAAYPVDIAAEPLYALSFGAFRRAGLDVTIQTIASGAAIVSAVAGGACDIGVSNIISLAFAYKSGIPITLVAPSGAYSSKAPTSVLMVANESPINTARDCNGKTIAVNSLRGITQYSAQAWVDKHGGDSKTLKFVELTASAIGPALRDGRIDVALVLEPYISAARGVARVLGDSYDAIGSSFLLAAFFSTTTFAQSKPDVLRRFNSAIHETALWANAHHKDTAEILARESKLDLGIIEGSARVEFAQRLTPESIQPNIDLAMKYGGLDAVSAKDLSWTPHP